MDPEDEKDVGHGATPLDRRQAIRKAALAAVFTPPEVIAGGSLQTPKKRPK